MGRQCWCADSLQAGEFDGFIPKKSIGDPLKFEDVQQAWQKTYALQSVDNYWRSHFTVDEAVGLNGICDFLLSYSPEVLEIEAPAIVIVKAKKADLRTGFGQCISEMVAAQRFNESEKSFCFHNLWIY